MLELKIDYFDLTDMTREELEKQLLDAGFDFNNKIIRYYDERQNLITYCQDVKE